LVVSSMSKNSGTCQEICGFQSIGLSPRRSAAT
jgi:hypothetical protein